MRKILIFALVLVFFAACNEGQFEKGKQNTVFLPADEKKNDDSKNILLITGEGGTSGGMFVKAAKTYQKENGGVIYEAKNGDDFVAAVRDFTQKYGKIDHLEYFGHGNEVGLYVNQEPNVNGGLYANDPGLDKDFRAASIYELPEDIFAKYGWIKFNGCNVANGYPEINSLAQSVANYFDVDLVAPRGPTEFSMNAEFVDPIPNSNYLDPNFAGEVYMVPTYTDKPFVVVKPQKASEVFEDLREGQTYYEAVLGLAGDGDEGAVSSSGKKFLPYKNITYAEAYKFCELAFEDKCKKPKSSIEGEWIRNLQALKMLVDAYGAKLKGSNPWYNSYVWWASQEGILTKDFTNRKWYTRGEMAELTWKIMQVR